MSRRQRGIQQWLELLSAGEPLVVGTTVVLGLAAAALLVLSLRSGFFLRIPVGTPQPDTPKRKTLRWPEDAPPNKA